MPLLHTADEVLKGSSRVDKVYKGSTLIWPPTTGETWSPWYEVGFAVAAAPCAWFGQYVTHYDSGGHEKVRFRYSNLGRVHWRGIMRSLADLSAGYGTIGCNINDPNVPKPAEDHRMGAGPDSPGYAPTWGGGFARFDAAPYAYHHLITLAHVTAAVIPNGSWFAIDTIYAFAADT